MRMKDVENAVREAFEYGFAVGGLWMSEESDQREIDEVIKIGKIQVVATIRANQQNRRKPFSRKESE